MKKLKLSALVCTYFLGLFSPTFTLAQTKAKQTPARSVEVKKVFGYYDIYLRLPRADRDGFRMSYLLNPSQASTRPQMTYVLGSIRTPIEIAPNGKVLTMPDADMFANGKIEIGAGQPSTSITLDLEAVVPLSRAISVGDASNPINDYAVAVRRAGPLVLLAPKLTGITFKGVSSGEAIFPDGRRVSLAPGTGGVVFRPALPALRGAVSLAFPVQPIAAEFAR
jgi:hypothetical protein